jgi:hypothetical protein
MIDGIDQKDSQYNEDDSFDDEISEFFHTYLKRCRRHRSDKLLSYFSIFSIDSGTRHEKFGEP